jgi:hypothetical protein|tara:strand:- start:1090 stop:1392 length:303 start_codon:yes stop_codon:yes gene_type:complete
MGDERKESRGYWGILVFEQSGDFVASYFKLDDKNSFDEAVDSGKYKNYWGPNDEDYALVDVLDYLWLKRRTSWDDITSIGSDMEDRLSPVLEEEEECEIL